MDPSGGVDFGRQNIEGGLQEIESRYRTLFEAIDEGFCIIEVLFDSQSRPVDYRFLEVNPAFEKQTGLTNAKGHTMRELAPQLETHWFEVYGRIALTGEPERFQKQAAQLHRWFDVYAFRIGDPKNRQVAILFTDVTQRRCAEEALRVSEQRFRAVAENIPQMIWVADEAGRVQYLSPKWLAYTGTTFEQNQNGGWKSFLHPNDLPKLRRRIQDATEADSVFETEYRLRRSDGEYRWHLARAVRIANTADGKTLWFGSTVDIEDQKRTHAALISAEKLVAVGRLASSIAHEINNPLAAAINSLYLALTDDGLSRETKKYIETAQGELERVAHLTKQTLGFHRGKRAPAQVDLSTVADDVIELYTPKLKNKDIMVDRQYCPGCEIQAVEGEIRQIVSNLISNSIDAVRHRGCIRLRIAIASWCQHCPMLRLTVSDNGSGIAQQHHAKLFEPFFSTKEATGTGLGLWVTQQLVTKYQGKIRARSLQDRGTVFEVYLPVQQLDLREAA
jgi:PAS domain S-box-containing protein